MWSDLTWFMWSDFVLKWSEVKWVTVKYLGTKVLVPCTLGWPYTEGTWLYCDYFIWCVSFTVVVLTCFEMCGWAYVGVFWQLCGSFANMSTCIYCVLYCVYCVFCIVSVMYIYSYFFCLYCCKTYCHRVKTQLQLVIIILTYLLTPWCTSCTYTLHGAESFLRS